MKSVVKENFVKFFFKLYDKAINILSKCETSSFSFFYIFTYICGTILRLVCTYMLRTFNFDPSRTPCVRLVYAVSPTNVEHQMYMIVRHRDTTCVHGKWASLR